MKLTKLERRKRIKRRIRKTIKGTSKIPRLSVFRSNKGIYAQLIDDTLGKTLIATSSMSEEIKAEGTKKEIANMVGKLIAKMAIEKGINSCIFDRNGYLYHGRVRTLAESAREMGLKF